MRTSAYNKKNRNYGRRYAVGGGMNPEGDAIAGVGNSAAQLGLNLVAPGLGTAFGAVTGLSDSATMNANGTYKSTGAEIANYLTNPLGFIGDAVTGDIGNKKAKEFVRQKSIEQRNDWATQGANNLRANIGAGYSQQGYDNIMYRKYGGSLNSYGSGGSIHIKPSKKGTFTTAAKSHGAGVQEFASRVLAHKENYSPAMVKKANFARNASKWHHAYGGGLKNNTDEGEGVNSPDYNVEGKEVVEGNNVQLDNQEKLASDMTMAKGPTHEQGGVDGKGGERVYSNRLKPNEDIIKLLKSVGVNPNQAKTYAQAAETIGRRQKRYEDKLSSEDRITSSTGKMMLSRIEQAKDMLYKDQQIQNGESQGTPAGATMRYGGYVRKRPVYPDGGELKGLKNKWDYNTNTYASDYDPFALVNQEPQPLGMVGLNSTNFAPKYDHYSMNPELAPVYNRPSNTSVNRNRITSTGSMQMTGTPNREKTTSDQGSMTTGNNDITRNNYSDVSGDSSQDSQDSQNKLAKYAGLIGPAINTLGYLNNLSDVNKLETNINPQYATPSYKRYYDRSGVGLNNNRIALNTAIRGVRSSSSRNANTNIANMIGQITDANNNVINNENLRRDTIEGNNVDVANNYGIYRANTANQFAVDNLGRRNELIPTRIAARNAYLDATMKQIRENRDTQFLNDSSDANAEMNVAQMKLSIMANQNGVADALASKYGIKGATPEEVYDRWIRENFVYKKHR